MLRLSGRRDNLHSKVVKSNGATLRHSRRSRRGRLIQLGRNLFGRTYGINWGYKEKSMRRFEIAALAAFAVISLATLLGAQESAQKGLPAGQKSATTVRQRALVLSGSIPLEGVKGRFDHFAAGKGRIFLSALG